LIPVKNIKRCQVSTVSKYALSSIKRLTARLKILAIQVALVIFSNHTIKHTL